MAFHPVVLRALEDNRLTVVTRRDQRVLGRPDERRERESRALDCDDGGAPWVDNCNRRVVTFRN